MAESAATMHSQVAGTAGLTEATCDQCRSPFKARRGWARFCSSKCRNAWHSAMRPEAVREARELVRLALEGCDPVTWNPRARKLLGIKG